MEKIKIFEEFENEKKITVYHGDNYGTTSINIDNMDLGGNRQEGIGIYFTTNLEIAQFYGKYVVSAEISKNKFIDSRDDIGNFLSINEMIGLFKYFWKIDSVSLYYLISNYVEIFEPTDITEYHLKKLAENMKTEEVRNFQITLAESFGVKNFVDAWCLNVKNIDGTVNHEFDFYCIINPKIELNIYSVA